VYKSFADKKKWIEAVKSDAQSNELANCLARTRVLLDKGQDIKDSKEKAAFLKVALEVYNKLPDGCEQPSGQPLSSLGMLIARAKLLQLLADEQQLKQEQMLAGTAYLAQQISKGFTRDGWHKVWFDPKSDSQLKEEDKARGIVVAAGLAAEQLLDAHAAYAGVILRHLARNADPVIKEAVDKLPKIMELKQPWLAEATAAKVRQNWGGEGLLAAASASSATDI
jgi:hypothetical protein